MYILDIQITKFYKILKKRILLKQQLNIILIIELLKYYIIVN